MGPRKRPRFLLRVLKLAFAASRKPVVIIRGINISDDEAAASDLLRDKDTDLFL